MELNVVKNKVGDISSINGMRVHPLANVVPLDNNLVSLMSSIKSTGLLHPIVMYKGEILDGRRRTLACLQLGIIPKQNELYDGSKEFTQDDLYGIVIAETTRRNLSAGQRAIIAAKQVIVGNHKLSGYKNSIRYAKSIWNVSDTTLTAAKWLFINHKALAEEIFELGFTTFGNKKWTGVSGLVKVLKSNKAPSAANGDELVAKALEAISLAMRGIAVTHDKKDITTALSIWSSKHLDTVIAADTIIE